MYSKHFLSILALSCLFLLFDVQVAQADEWEDMGVTDGVSVSRMSVEGTSVLAFRGEVVADVHIGRIMQVFLDPDQRQHWVDRYEAHETLERTDTTELYWIRFDLPFPVSDRDYLLRARAEIDEDAGVFIARIRSVVDRRKPEQRCCVRAETETFYRFEAVPGREQTRLIVEVHTDPQGLIPNWLVNRIQRDWPSTTLSNLINRAQSSGIAIHPDYRDWHSR